MKKLISVLISAGLILCFAITASAVPVEVTFDEGWAHDPTGDPTYWLTTYGLSFQDVVWYGNGAGTGIGNGTPEEGPGTPHVDGRINFLAGVTSLDITWDLRAFAWEDPQTITIAIYDAANNWLNSPDFTSPAYTEGNATGVYSYSGSTDIAYLIFHDSGKRVGIDNLILNSASGAAPVPEPATLFLLGGGLIGVIGLKKKKKKT